MATIDSLDIVLKTLNNNGVYCVEDGSVYSIISYLNPWGKRSIAFCYSRQDEDRYLAGVHDVCILWSKHGLTFSGKCFLASVESGEIKQLPY